MAYTISVDQEACIGCGACVSTCEKAFKLVDNKSVPLKKEVEELTCEQEAADICPVNCITIKEK
jgi:ferredoxin